jgi:hypothetical protein
MRPTEGFENEMRRPSNTDGLLFISGQDKPDQKKKAALWRPSSINKPLLFEQGLITIQLLPAYLSLI